MAGHSTSVLTFGPFGCVLYEALTGKLAFIGDTVPDTLMAVLGKEPDWNALPKDTSSRLRQLLSRTLRKNARLRLHDIADARIELDDDLSDPRIGLARAERSLTRIAVTAVAAGMLTGLAVWSAMRSSAPDAGRVSRTAILLPSGEVLERDERAPAFAISPNGQYVAYITRRGSETQLYLRSVDELDPTPIDGADGARMPFFSPDSAWLGFIADGELRKVSLTGGAPVTIASVDPNYRGISWGDGGTIVLSTNNTELWRVPAEGGEPERLTIPDRERGERAHRFPTVLPGGEAVLFTVLPGDIESWDDASLAVLSLETGEYDVVLEGGRFSKYSPTGHLIYARAGSLLAVPFDLAELDIKGAPVPLVQEVAMSLKDGSSEFALSSDGSLLYAPGGSWGVDHRVVWVDRTGRVEPILNDSARLRASRSVT